MSGAPILTTQHHVVVVGAGGNIGSHLVPHLARLQPVGRMTLIDRETYEPANLRSQDITVPDIGNTKAEVQAARVRQINPALAVSTFVEAVENMPLGHLRADLIVACVDSRETRQYLNEAAWRLGVPWVDAGVQADGLLARVNVYRPGTESPCLECGWDQHDYAALPQHYPCQGLQEHPRATRAPSSLGALAAALQALECQKILTGQWEQVMVGKQVVIDARYQQHYCTRTPWNPACRFDHGVWPITQLPSSPADLSLRDVFTLAQQEPAMSSATLQFFARPFIMQWTCMGCGHIQPHMRFTSASTRPTCQCGQAMLATGRNAVAWLDAHMLPTSLLRQPLSALGVQPGDICTLRARERKYHYQIGAV